MEEKLVFKQLSSLHKVFLDEKLEGLREVAGTTALRGERVSWQILYTNAADRAPHKVPVSFRAYADERLALTFRSVGNVPVAYAANPWADEDYLRKSPGLYPDVLYPQEGGELDVVLGVCHSLFITALVPQDLEAGAYPVGIVLESEGTRVEKTFTIRVLEASLPEQDLICTQWFHADCIADHYGVEIFSARHWELIEQFLAMAVHMGSNMILTPLFTPPLDTRVGGRRPTVQLVDVFCQNGRYTFGFDRLKKWIDICRRQGIRYFEMSHLFSQWNTGYPPKIVAKTEEGEEEIFGWSESALSGGYGEFLRAFLPELTSFLKEEGIYEDVYFHVADEPDLSRDGHPYQQEREMLRGLIPDDKFMDAMSHFEFYERGLTHRPVVILDQISLFLEKGCRDIWAYYCCQPCDDGYINRLIAMPSRRTRFLGFLLYRYDIKGFLHWGYNFYYSQLSKRLIDPFLVTDADEGFPSGDAFVVYPGKDGPLESLRSVAFYEGLQDYRACRLLEGRIGRNAVEAILTDAGVLDFRTYPRTDQGLLDLREAIYNRLEAIKR